MGTSIDFDIKDFIKGAENLVNKVGSDIGQPIREVALEVLRLSTYEVPMTKGSCSLVAS